MNERQKYLGDLPNQVDVEFIGIAHEFKEKKMNTRQKPHKHADLIHAWADGAEIEYFDIAFNQWIGTTRPTWGDDVEYRIKPEKLKIRFRNYLAVNGEVETTTNGSFELSLRFKRWIGDWQEVEVEK